MKQYLKTACAGVSSITKEACIGIFSQDTDARNYLEKLDFDSWDVTSFNPIKKEICIVLYHKNHIGKIVGERYVSFSIPTL